MEFVELFAGAGGLGRGLEAAGMTHTLSFEWNPAAHDVLVHSGKKAYKTDLNDIAGTVFLVSGRPDIVVGGPPCQDFSKAGSQEEKENARLTPIFAMTIAILKPEWFLFENVDRAPHKKAYQQARALWQRAGYGLTEVMIECDSYGVPQSRKRFICIGRLGERDGFLEDAVVAAASPTNMVVRDILDPRKYPEDRELLDKGYFWARPWSGKSGEVGGRGVRSIDEPCPTIIRTTHEKPGPAYVAHPEDPIPAGDAHLLTLTQIARIQGFPKGFDFRRNSFKYARDGWSDRDVAQMIANAVPSPTAEVLGRVIMARDNGETIPALAPGFAEFLKKPNPRTGRKGLENPAAIANVKSRVNRARRLLGGRTYSSAADELAALEATGQFSFLPIESTREGADVKAFQKGTLDVRSKSDLRSALRLYREFQDGLKLSKWQELAEHIKLRERGRRLPHNKNKKKLALPKPQPQVLPGKPSLFRLPRLNTGEKLELSKRMTQQHLANFFEDADEFD